MVVLRSRDVRPPNPPKGAPPEPPTPAQFREPTPSHAPLEIPPTQPRRSLRLASLPSPSGYSPSSGPRKRIKERGKRAAGDPPGDNNCSSSPLSGISSMTGLEINLRHYTLSSSLGTMSEDNGSSSRNGAEEKKEGEEFVEEAKLGFDEGGILNLIDKVGESEKGGEEEQVEGFTEDRVLDLLGNFGGAMGVEDRKWKRIQEGVEIEELVEVHDGIEDAAESSVWVLGSNWHGKLQARKKAKYSSEEKAKGKLVGDAEEMKRMDRKELESRLRDAMESGNSELQSQLRYWLDELVERNEEAKRENRERHSEWRMERYRDVARKNASRFAHFGQEEAQLSPEGDAREPSVQEEERKDEDWPGPFSCAMKIVRDRANKSTSREGAGTSEKGKSVPITWVPKKVLGCDRPKVSVPSLQEMCLAILVKNADSITSLECVPDALRHRLCNLLCDSRRMNSYFLDLLVRGSPTEIRIRDCSWLTEEAFTKCFEECDISSLTVLQLDQCGRCMADYTVLPTLARLPMLTALSLGGACRLSDSGLRSLVSAAPSLRSINLNQCSLLTSASIETISNSLGSVLCELYINDCQSIDAMLILPALKKIQHLEVLSIAGIQTVSDGFIEGLAIQRGHNMKELILTDCVELSDFSLRVIAETCPGLRSLDLVNLSKLTDAALGYLANGCREIQTLKLCRNAFSDDAIAAFVETSGALLKELSLNNVKKVDNNTSLSLARHARNLVSLDLSWCRSLTDEAVGLIVDSCLSLRVLKLFGCAQITSTFYNGHSNPEVQIIGLKMSPVLRLRIPDPQECVLRYSSF